MKNLELNKVHCGDCLELLCMLEDESIDLIITSPPYNKGGKKDSKSNIFHSKIEYDEYVDYKKEEDYQAFELKWLSIAFKKLKKGGSLFYNHKERQNGKGGTIIPDEWLRESPFTIRQRIIWDRGGAFNNCATLCADQAELIYWMTKPDDKGKVKINKQKFLDEKGKLIGLTNIWRFSPEKKKAFDHPAPFPLGLPIRCLHLILGQPERYNSAEPFIVLDPFFGTGTTGVAASQYRGVSWLGFDLSKDYAKQAQCRVDEFKKSLKEKEKDSIWE